MHLSKRLALLACSLTFVAGTPVAATVISGDSSGTAIGISLTGLLPISLPSLVTTSGTAPGPYSNSANLATLPPPPPPLTLSSGFLEVTAASDVDGLAGSRFASASAEINNLTLGVLAVLAVSATEINSTSVVSGEPLGGVGTVGFVNGSVTVLGTPTPIPVNPAPNTVLVNTGGIQVILNEQIFSGSLDLTVNAIRILLSNAGGLGINGEIVIAQSQAALAVPEPSTALLLGLGVTLLAARARRGATPR